MEYPKEQFKVEYSEFKRSILLNEDIQLLSSVSEEVSRLPKATDAGQLIEIESNLASFGFQLAGVYGRLIGQYNVEKDIFEKKRANLTDKYKSEGMKTGFVPKVNEELTEDMKQMALFEGVVEEYKAKMQALNHVHLAITHRLRKLEK